MHWLNIIYETKISSSDENDPFAIDEPGTLGQCTTVMHFLDTRFMLCPNSTFQPFELNESLGSSVLVISRPCICHLLAQRPQSFIITPLRPEIISRRLVPPSGTGLSGGRGSSGVGTVGQRLGHQLAWRALSPSTVGGWQQM